MSTLTLPLVVTSIRSLVGDLGTEQMQTVRKESLGGDVDGVNKLYILQYYPIVAASLTLWKNNVVLATPADYTVDLTRGEITMVAAPAIADRIEASYTFLWFPDDGYHQFIIAGAGECGITSSAGTNLELATLVLGLAPEGLVQVIRLYAGCHYNLRRSDQSAHKFNASAGGQSQSVDSVTKNFRDLAKQLCDRAAKARKDFYADFGARDSIGVAHGSIAFKRYQPRR